MRVAVVVVLGLLAISAQASARKKDREIRLLEKVIDAALHKTQKLETRQDDEESGDDVWDYESDVIDTGGEGEDCPGDSKRSNLLKLLKRVVNGEDAGADEFPWLAAMLQDGEVQCGSTMITSRVAVTAAHCFFNDTGDLVDTPSRWKLRLNAQCNVESTASPAVTLDVKHIIRHACYELEDEIHDIALVIVEDHSHTVTTLLRSHDSSDQFDQQRCMVAGFGATRMQDYSPRLKKAEVTVSKDCNTSTTAHTVCAKDMDGMDTCSGDSGGPLMCSDGGTTKLVGIVSFGVPGEDQSDHCDRGGVYVDVAHYDDWIENNLSSTETGTCSTKK